MQHTLNRKQSIEKAREILARKPVYLDTETTGLHSTAEIVEIAIMDDEGAILFESYIRPSRPIPADATRIHHITDAMCKNAPLWPVLWPDVRSILSEKYLAIYNAEYDLRMMQSSLKQYNLPSVVHFQNSCIMKLYANFRGEWNSKYQSFRYFSLADAGQYFKISIPNSHRAKDDALLARAVLHSIANSQM